MHLPIPPAGEFALCRCFLKPSEYPLRSVQSRAAAMALLERRFAGRKRIDVVNSVPRSVVIQESASALGLRSLMGAVPVQHPPSRDDV